MHDAGQRFRYPAIEAQAKAQGGEIHWGDETAVINTDVRGRSYSPKAKLKAAAENHMDRLAQSPDAVRAFFRDPRCKYAA